jgi:MoxR-like ATPase
MSTKKSKSVETFSLKPSEVEAAIRNGRRSNRAVFLWGPPGISKSATAAAVATAQNMAFIDIRLSQLDPTDLRGIPYPTEISGVEAVRWSVPYAMPKDLDIDFNANITDGEQRVDFANPTGSNGIHYCTNPKIKVKSLVEGATAKIVQQFLEDDDGEIIYFDDIGDVTTKSKGNPQTVKNLDRVKIVLVDDATGNPVSGRVNIKVRGKVQAILALEEFNSAPPSVQAAAYQLVLDRRLGEYIIPKGVSIVAMGNRDTDKGVTFKMPTPIANRFIHVEMRTDFDDWQKWAIKNFVHRDVVGYLTAFKDHLFQFEASTAARGFPTPRSWEFVSDTLIADEEHSEPEMVIHGLVAGCVGEGCGVQFMEFRKIARDLPRAEDILSGRLKKMKEPAQVSLSYALTTTLCYELKERENKLRRVNGDKWNKSADYKKWLAEADNFLEFMMENFQPEICIMGAKAAIQIHSLPFDVQAMKNFNVFADRYKKLVLG